MFITPEGLQALCHLRSELQENAGEHFPHQVLTELLVLYDVCHCLQLSEAQSTEILGEFAWQYVTDYVNAPAMSSINWKRISKAGDPRTRR